MPLRIERDTKKRIWERLVPLADRYYERVQLLKAKDWYAFEQEILFEESFCSGPEELELLRRVKIEVIKEDLLFGVYKSDLAQQLRDGSAAWVSRLQPSILSAFPEAITRPAQARVKLMVTDKEKFDRLRAPFVEECDRLRALEVQRHSVFSKGPLFDSSRMEDRLQLYLAVVGEVGPRLGFEFNKKLSKRKSPVFSKRSGDWTVILVVDRVPLTRQPLTQANSQERDYGGLSNLDMFIGLLPGHAVVPLGPAPSLGAIGIALDRFAPIGLEFRGFWDLHQLERNIRGYVAALGTFQEELEQLISTCPACSTTR